MTNLKFKRTNFVGNWFDSPLLPHKIWVSNDNRFFTIYLGKDGGGKSPWRWVAVNKKDPTDIVKSRHALKTKKEAIRNMTGILTNIAKSRGFHNEDIQLKSFKKYLEEKKKDLSKLVSKGIFAQEGKKINLERTARLFLGAVDKDDFYTDLTWKEYKLLNVPDTSHEKTKEEFIHALLNQEPHFGKKVDFNSFSKKGNPSFEDKVDWILKNTRAKYTTKGLKV